MRNKNVKSFWGFLKTFSHYLFFQICSLSKHGTICHKLKTNKEWTKKTSNCEKWIKNICRKSSSVLLSSSYLRLKGIIAKRRDNCQDGGRFWTDSLQVNFYNECIKGFWPTYQICLEIIRGPRQNSNQWNLSHRSFVLNHILVNTIFITLNAISPSSSHQLKLRNKYCIWNLVDIFTSTGIEG